MLKLSPSAYVRAVEYYSAAAVEGVSLFYPRQLTELRQWHWQGKGKLVSRRRRHRLLGEFVYLHTGAGVDVHI